MDTFLVSIECHLPCPSSVCAYVPRILNSLAGTTYFCIWSGVPCFSMVGINMTWWRPRGLFSWLPAALGKNGYMVRKGLFFINKWFRKKTLNVMFIRMYVRICICYCLRVIIYVFSLISIYVWNALHQGTIKSCFKSLLSQLFPLYMPNFALSLWTGDNSTKTFPYVLKDQLKGSALFNK